MVDQVDKATRSRTMAAIRSRDTKPEKWVRSMLHKREKKFAHNIARDQKVLYQLKVMGWRAAIVWECGLKKKVRVNNLQHLACWLRSSEEYIEIPEPSELLIIDG